MSARVASFVALALACACRVGPDYEQPPAIDLPAEWIEASAPAPTAEPEIEWWKRFEDPELDALIERALAANLDVGLARARLREARALRDVSVGERAPQIDGGASYARQQGSLNNAQGSFGERRDDFFQLGFDASWEIDVFGHNARAVEAAEAGVAAAEHDLRATRVSLLGEVARSYVELCGLQRAIALTRANVDRQRDTLELTRARFTAGFATDLDVARAEALVATTSAQIPASESNLQQTIHRLGVLLGVVPESLVNELARERPIPPAPATIATGLPSELLRRRPDIARAERELAQATALTARATAELFPRLTLGATLAQQSNELGDLLHADSTAWSIGPALTAPLFNGGRLRANVRVQGARQEQASIAYQQTVLLALAEVEDALAAVARERTRLATLNEAFEANRRAVAMAEELNQRGLVDFFEVLAAQREQFDSELEVARSASILSAQVVALYKALGGGWQIAEDDLARAEDPAR